MLGTDCQAERLRIPVHCKFNIFFETKCEKKDLSMKKASNLDWKPNVHKRRIKVWKALYILKRNISTTENQYSCFYSTICLVSLQQ